MILNIQKYNIQIKICGRKVGLNGLDSVPLFFFIKYFFSFSTYLYSFCIFAVLYYRFYIFRFKSYSFRFFFQFNIFVSLIFLLQIQTLFPDVAQSLTVTRVAFRRRRNKETYGSTLSTHCIQDDVKPLTPGTKFCLAVLDSTRQNHRIKSLNCLRLYRSTTT